LTTDRLGRRIVEREERVITELLQWLQSESGLPPVVFAKVLKTLAALLCVVIVRTILAAIIHRRTDDVRARYRASKAATYSITLLGVLFIGSIWFSGFRSFSTYMGLLSAGVAIALKDPLASIAGWLYILGRRPFEVGDRISIGEHSGDIIDLRLFRFAMLEIGNWVDADQSTGRIIHIPNSQVFTSPIANYTSGFQYIWNELPVLITFESDWRKAKKILGSIAAEHFTATSEKAGKAIRKAARSQMIMYSKLTPRVWTQVADSGVMLTIRYLCDPRQRRSTAELLWEHILDEFGKTGDIDFAYPTIRRYSEPEEGKKARSAQEPPRPESS